MICLELAKAPHTRPLSRPGRGIFLFDLGRHQSRGQGPESETDQSDTDHKAAHTEHHAEDGKGSNLDLGKKGGNADRSTDEAHHDLQQDSQSNHGVWSIKSSQNKPDQEQKQAKERNAKRCDSQPRMS